MPKGRALYNLEENFEEFIRLNIERFFWIRAGKLE
jgi:hypothetical protein